MPAHKRTALASPAPSPAPSPAHPPARLRPSLITARRGDRYFEHTPAQTARPPVAPCLLSSTRRSVTTAPAPHPRRTRSDPSTPISPRPPSPNRAMKMGPRLRDESMRAYDAGNIPGLRRPRGDDARVAAWVADGSAASLDRLVRTARLRASAGEATARAVRRACRRALSLRHAARARSGRHAHAPRRVLQPLHLQRALLRRAVGARRAGAAPRARVLVLVRAATSGSAASRSSQRCRRRRSARSCAACPPRNRRRLPERGHVLTREELEASLALLDRLLAAADDARGWRSVAPAARSLAQNVRRAVPAGDDYTLYDNPFEYDAADDDAATLLLPRDAPPAGATSKPASTRVSA
eukprot:IDg11902t1